MRLIASDGLRLTCMAASASCASTRTTTACKSAGCAPPRASHWARRCILHVDASLWLPGDDNAFDLTEAYIQHRLVPG